MSAGMTRIKNIIRVIEAVSQPRIRSVSYRGQTGRFIRSIWWDNTLPDIVARELDGYFKAMARHGWVPQGILDVGAEGGLFSIFASRIFNPRWLFVIEPSQRNRILLNRNLSLNKVSVAGMSRAALWKESAKLSFRSHGALSAIQGVGDLMNLPFVERVQAETLDATIQRWGVPGVDLIKMDIEGAEIEALEGAELTLGDGGIRPKVLIQAYHLRNGRRTLEKCADQLTKFGYICEEETPGLLVGWPR